MFVINEKAAVKIGFYKANQSKKFYEFCRINGVKDKEKQQSLWKEYKISLKK